MLTRSTIEKTVTGLDGGINLIGAGVIRHLPQAEANKWHVIATVQLDGWRSHFDKCPSLVKSTRMARYLSSNSNDSSGLSRAASDASLR